MTTTQRKYVPCIYQDVLGVSGFSGRTTTMFCLIADNGNHFIMDGIVKNSLLFVDRAKPYSRNALNVFQNTKENPSSYVLSKDFLACTVYCGRVVASINQYEDTDIPEVYDVNQPLPEATTC